MGRLTWIQPTERRKRKRYYVTNNKIFDKKGIDKTCKQNLVVDMAFLKKIARKFNRTEKSTKTLEKFISQRRQLSWYAQPEKKTTALLRKYQKRAGKLKETAEFQGNGGSRASRSLEKEVEKH